MVVSWYHTFTCHSLHHTINRAVFVCLSVCLSVCSLSPPRSFDGSSPNFVGVCRWTSELPLRGSFSKRSTGRRINGSLSLSTILYMHQPHATQLQKAPLAVLHLNGVCRWTSQLPFRGSFSKTSMGRRVNGSNRSTGHFHFHYIYIYDSRRRQAHTTPLQKAYGVWSHQAHATPLQKAQRLLLAQPINFLAQLNMSCVNVLNYCYSKGSVYNDILSYILLFTLYICEPPGLSKNLLFCEHCI